MANKTYNVSQDESTNKAIVTPADDPTYASPVSRASNVTIAITVPKTPIGNLTAKINDATSKVDAPKISDFLSNLVILEDTNDDDTPDTDILTGASETAHSASYTKWEASNDGSNWTDVAFSESTKQVAKLNGAIPAYYRFTITVNPLGGTSTLLAGGEEHEITLDEEIDSDEWSIVNAIVAVDSE